MNINRIITYITNPIYIDRDQQVLPWCPHRTSMHPQINPQTAEDGRTFELEFQILPAKQNLPYRIPRRLEHQRQVPHTNPVPLRAAGQAALTMCTRKQPKHKSATPSRLAHQESSCGWRAKPHSPPSTCR